MKNLYLIFLFLHAFVYAQEKKVFRSIEWPEFEDNKFALSIKYHKNLNYFDSTEIKANNFRNVTIVQTQLYTDKVVKVDTILAFNFDEDGKTVEQIMFSEYPNDTTNLAKWWKKIHTLEENERIYYTKKGKDSIFTTYELMDGNVDTAAIYIQIQNDRGQLIESHVINVEKFRDYEACYNKSRSSYFKYDKQGRIKESGIIAGFYQKYFYEDGFIQIEKFNDEDSLLKTEIMLVSSSEYGISKITSKESLTIKHLDNCNKLIGRIWYVNFIGYSMNYTFIYH